METFVVGLITLVTCIAVGVLVVLPVWTHRRARMQHAGAIVAKQQTAHADSHPERERLRPLVEYDKYSWKVLDFNLPLLCMHAFKGPWEKFAHVRSVIGEVDQGFVALFRRTFDSCDDDMLLYTLVQNSFLCYATTIDDKGRTVIDTSTSTNFVTRCNKRLIAAHGMAPFLMVLDPVRHRVVGVRVCAKRGRSALVTSKSVDWEGAKHHVRGGLMAICRSWLVALYLYMHRVHVSVRATMTHADPAYPVLLDSTAEYAAHAGLIQERLCEGMSDRIRRSQVWMARHMHVSMDMSHHTDVLNNRYAAGIPYLQRKVFRPFCRGKGVEGGLDRWSGRLALDEERAASVDVLRRRLLTTFSLSVAIRSLSKVCVLSITPAFNEETGDAYCDEIMMRNVKNAYMVHCMIPGGGQLHRMFPSACRHAQIVQYRLTMEKDIPSPLYSEWTMDQTQQPRVVSRLSEVPLHAADDRIDEVDDTSSDEEDTSSDEEDTSSDEEDTSSDEDGGLVDMEEMYSSDDGI